ncbi:MAG: heavy metal translocating P-type ATPase [Leptospirillia bacterium]
MKTSSLSSFSPPVDSSGSVSPPEDLCDVDFPVLGMTCAACSGRVTRALKKIPGVSEVSVNLATHRASLFFDSHRTTPEEIIESVRESGYEADPDTFSFDLSPELGPGDDLRINAALSGVAGVLSVSVIPSLSHAGVVCLRGEKTEARLLSALASKGFTAKVEEREAPPGRDEREFKRLFRDFLVATLLSIPLVFLAMIPLPEGFFSRIFPTPRSLWAFEALLAAAVFLGPGRRFLAPGLRAYRHLSPDMNSLVMTGTGAALFYSLLVLAVPGIFPPADRHVYFETTGMVIAVILLGRTLEARARRRTGDALAAFSALVPETSERFEAGEWVRVPSRDLVAGDLVRVPAGERIPADGVVVRGRAHVDLSAMTGEPMPVTATAKTRVFCGTSPTDAPLEILTEALGNETRLAGIVRAVMRAQGAKLPVEALADRVVAVFTPAVLFVSLLTFVLWLLLDRSGGGLVHGLESAVAVLLVACPCAMGLATPAAVMVGTGRAARLGILFRRGTSLEGLSKVERILFDKTGTLTLGTPSVVDLYAVPGGEEGRRGKADAGVGQEAEGGVAEGEGVTEGEKRLLSVAAALESGSTHPLARAIAEAAKIRGLSVSGAREINVLAGRGVTGEVDGQEGFLGNLRLLDERGIAIDGVVERVKAWEGEAKTVVFVVLGGRLLGGIAISDPLRPEARQVVGELFEMGIRSVLVTGDASGPAEAVARETGIDEIHARVDPLEKGAIVAGLVQKGERVAFVGDGINDAPALASATVGLALSSGTGVAIESADVTLAGPGISRLPAAVALSRKTMRTIRTNLFWAFGYNIVLIPLAAGAARPFFGIGLDPMWAGAAMGLSSVLVVGNSLRLSGFADRGIDGQSLKKES